MVSDVEKLPLDILKDKKSIAISSGASTPSDVIDEIYNVLINL